MCLMLYLAVDKPMTPFRERTAEGEVFLRRVARKYMPDEIAPKNHYYFVADYDCSCVFLGDDPDAVTLKARERLAEIAAAAVKLDRDAVFYSEWLGDAPDSGPVQRYLKPQDFTAGATWAGVTRAPVFYRFGKPRRGAP